MLGEGIIKNLAREEGGTKAFFLLSSINKKHILSFAN